MVIGKGIQNNECLAVIPDHVHVARLLLLLLLCLPYFSSGDLLLARQPIDGSEAESARGEEVSLVGPFVFVEGEQQDLGTANIATILQDVQLDFVVRLKNSSKSPLFLNKIEASCGCVSTGTLRGNIAAGESVDLPFKIRKSTIGQYGVDMRLHEASGKIWTAKIVGEVVPAVEFVPDLLLIDREVGFRKVVELKCNDSSLVLTKDDVTIMDKPDGIKVATLSSKEGGVSLSITLSDRGIAASGTITIKIRGGDEAFVARLPLRCNDGFELLPSTVLLQSKEGDEEHFFANFYVRCYKPNAFTELNAKAGTFRLVNTDEQLIAELVSYQKVSEKLVKVRYRIGREGLENQLSAQAVAFLSGDEPESVINFFAK
jgi:hypothetical protein